MSHVREMLQTHPQLSEADMSMTAACRAGTGPGLRICLLFQQNNGIEMTSVHSNHPAALFGTDRPEAVYVGAHYGR